MKFFNIKGIFSTKRSKPVVQTHARPEMITVRAGILDEEMMSVIVEKYNARQGATLIALGGVSAASSLPGPLKGCSVQTYFVAPECAKAFKGEARVAENAGQPLSKRIIGVNGQFHDAASLKAIVNHYGAEKIEHVALKERRFPSLKGASLKDVSLYAVPKQYKTQFVRDVKNEGQLLLAM